MDVLAGVSQLASVITAHRSTSDNRDLHKKRHPESLRVPGGKKARLLCAEDRVFGRFGDTKLHGALGGNIDLFASRRIAPIASRAIYQNQLAKTRQCESVPGVFVSQLADAIEDFSGLF